MIIIASLEYIKCINIFETCKGNYHVVTSDIVYGEFTKKAKKEDIDLFNKLVTVHDLSGDPKYNELLEYVTNRYPKLHKGELSSFLVMVLEYIVKGKNSYYVTDDQTAKKVFTNIQNDKIFMGLLGSSFEPPKVTGLVGLVKRLREKGLLSKDSPKAIKTDLKKNGYFLSEELLKLLDTI